MSCRARNPVWGSASNAVVKQASRGPTSRPPHVHRSVNSCFPYTRFRRNCLASLPARWGIVTRSSRSSVADGPISAQCAMPAPFGRRAYSGDRAGFGLQAGGASARSRRRAGRRRPRTIWQSQSGWRQPDARAAARGDCTLGAAGARTSGDVSSSAAIRPRTNPAAGLPPRSTRRQLAEDPVLAERHTAPAIGLDRATVQDARRASRRSVAALDRPRRRRGAARFSQQRRQPATMPPAPRAAGAAAG